jgi:hypothetical protein
MRKFALALSAALGLTLSLPATSQEVANTNVTLTCNVSGLYPDGTRIQGTGSEKIGIDIRSPSLAAPASNNIRVTANGRTYQGTLLRSAANQLAFSYVSDATIDGTPQTLALTYEVRLDQPRLRRTVMALFSNQFGNALSAESNCVQPGAAVSPAAASAAPDWVIELRRKLKECGGKDPFSESACIERMQERFCANRSPKPPECEGK